MIARYRDPQSQHAASIKMTAWKRAARHLQEASAALMIAGAPDEWTVTADGERFSVATLLQQWSQIAAALSRSSIPQMLSPRALFFDNVLDYWIAAGGRLQFSRSGKGGGPTVRYLRAVAEPVRRVPTVEGARNIIERCKQRRSELPIDCAAALDEQAKRVRTCLGRIEKKLQTAEISDDEARELLAWLSTITIRAEWILNSMKSFALPRISGGL